jgi:hypothetical protein
MARCSYCGDTTELYAGPNPICAKCCRENTEVISLAGSDLTKARLEMRLALGEISRLKDLYVSMPKPSSDGDLAIKQAQRTYERADDELQRALNAYVAALKR